MRRRRLTGLLVIATFALAVLGETLSVTRRGGWLGIACFGVAAACAVLAWWALGAPVRRRDISAPTR
jgi:hypothetical protein